MISFRTCPNCFKAITGEIQICPRCGWQLDALPEEHAAKAQLTTSLTPPTLSTDGSTMAEGRSTEVQPATPSADDQAALTRKAGAQGKRSFGLSWIIANTFGWGIGLLLAVPVGWISSLLYQSSIAGSVFNPLASDLTRTLIQMIIWGGCWGAIIGGLQQSIFARRLELQVKRWLFATIVGTTLYLTAWYLSPYFSQLIMGPIFSILPTGTFVSLAFSLALPLVFGIAQWFVLRQYFTRSGWWVAATTLSMGLAAVITSGLSRHVTTRSAGFGDSMLFSSATFLVEGLFYGIATWIVLTNIPRRSVGTHVNTPYEGERFNWKLPLFGAIGFWVGFAFTNAIGATKFNIATNALADIFPNTRVGLEAGLLRGIIVGGAGGGALGLAFKDKTRAIYFSLIGAAGFAIAFTLVISLGPNIVPDLGRTIIRLMGGPSSYLSSFETSLAHGLGTGAIVGAIGGSILGLASPKGRLVSCLLLCFTGVIWFGNAFAFASTLPLGEASFSWEGLAGAVGGAIFGLTLALCYKIGDNLKSINFPRALLGQYHR